MCRAIIRPSSVGMTRARALLPDVGVRAAVNGAVPGPDQRLLGKADLEPAKKRHNLVLVRLRFSALYDVRFR